MTERIGIIGLGYVGLPLAQLFISNGYHVMGIDINAEKRKVLREGQTYLPMIKDEEIAQMNASQRFHVTDEFSALENVEVIIICVPTPLKNNEEPDLSYIEAAIQAMLPSLTTGQVIILESSTYPGTTEEWLKPLLETSGLKVGEELFLGFSPERIDPGNSFELQSIPKIISGMTTKCLDRIEHVYSKVFDKVITVKSPTIAEMAKLLENTQRFINISFMNEIARLCHHLSIDVWEVLQAASTKPFGFTPYSPGPGIGGHCIPVDPIYLKWKAEQQGIESPFINLAKKIDDEQPFYICRRIQALIANNQEITQQNILLIGIAYKKNINDMRESKSITIFKELINMDYNVDYHDPYFQEMPIDDVIYKSIELNQENLSTYDCVVIATNHDTINYEEICNHASLIFDTRNCIEGNYTNVHRL